MHINECNWILENLSRIESINISPILDLGGSTLKYRTIDQPWLDKLFYNKLKELNLDISFSDIKDDIGVDIVGDIFDDDVFDIKWEIEYTPTEGELEFMNDRQKEINALESFCPFEFNSELNSLYMKGLEKYGSWYYLLSDGVLLQKPMSQGDTLDDAPFYDSNDDELVVVCSTAFNDEERKEFDNDMKQLFGDSYNGLSAQSVG